MSMPGFVFHIYCPDCQNRSPDYSLYVFPDLFRADIVLPAWSPRFRCYSEVHCFLSNDDRATMENQHDHLRSFAKELSSPALVVGVPSWSTGAGTICVKLDPAADCPVCGGRTEVLPGYPPKKCMAALPEEFDPLLPVHMLGLSVRASHCLESARILSLGELCKCSPEKLLAIPLFGASTLREIRDKLAAIGEKLSED